MPIVLLVLSFLVGRASQRAAWDSGYAMPDSFLLQADAAGIANGQRSFLDLCESLQVVMRRVISG